MNCVTAGGKAFTADKIQPEKCLPGKVNLTALPCLGYIARLQCECHNTIIAQE